MPVLFEFGNNSTANPWLALCTVCGRNPMEGFGGELGVATNVFDSCSSNLSGNITSKVAKAQQHWH
jgi:hypothetical protein